MNRDVISHHFLLPPDVRVGWSRRKARRRCDALMESDGRLDVRANIPAGSRNGSRKGIRELLSCSSSIEYEITRDLPIFLEMLILLVGTGLGILPALERAIKRHSHTALSRTFEELYTNAVAGMPLKDAFTQAIEGTQHRGLRHVLLHLDISGCEGGELIPSLRHLSEYSHTLWKLSVEHRIKRLETLIVVPVFLCVIGLMLLTAAVPLVPLFEMQERLGTETHVLR